MPVRRSLVTLLVLGLLTGTLAGGLTATTVRDAHAAPTHYVEMSDGTKIAVNVRVPEGCTADSPCPTVLEMAGYENGSADGKTPVGDVADLTGLPLPLQEGSRATHSVFFYDNYVTVQASLRGTGCSTGELDLFSRRSALDGKELIDGWIPNQPWSNGDVALFGHSYSGIIATMIAATRPDHLRAASVSGLIGDLYRDIVYPGGVTNYGFPLLWTGVVRPLYDVGGGVGGGVVPPADSSPECVTNQTRKSRALLEDPLVHGLDDTDSQWYRARSLTEYAARIAVPVHVTGTYHDEQTGPRGTVNTFLHLPDGISKRLVVTNGDHGTNTDPNVRRDRLSWLDYWMLDRERDDLGLRTGAVHLAEVFGPRTRPTTTSRVILGYQEDGEAVGELHSDGFPLAGTSFTDLYVTGDGRLTRDRDAVESASYRWVNGSRRQSYSHQAGPETGAEVTSPTGPDEVELSITFDRPTVVAGPITARLDVASSAPDTELFVQLIDRAPSGESLYLQRGMLRASHRSVDEARSRHTAAGRNWWPYRPHTNPTLVTPGERTSYLLQVFPVGHVFLPGHELVVKVHAPPLVDNDYIYLPKTLPGVNTLHTGSDRPSSLMLPMVPLDEVVGYDPGVGPCEYEAMRCVQPTG